MERRSGGALMGSIEQKKIETGAKYADDL